MDKSSNPIKLVAVIFLAGSGLFSVVGSVHAEISLAQREACTPDALRLCSSAIPDVDKVKTCMLENKANLSARCRAAFPAEPIQQAPSRIALERIQGTSANRHVALIKRAPVHDGSRRNGYRTEVAAATAGRTRNRHHSGANAFGTNDLVGLIGSGRQISPNEAIGMARQILTTYRAACGSRAIPADYCGF